MGNICVSNGTYYMHLFRYMPYLLLLLLQQAAQCITLALLCKNSAMCPGSLHAYQAHATTRSLYNDANNITNRNFICIIYYIYVYICMVEYISGCHSNRVLFPYRVEK